MPADFETKKKEILRQLLVDPESYTDKSPKGSVDDAIVDLVKDINDIDSLVTTSSCAGRVSVFLEGRREHGVGLNNDGPGDLVRTSDGGKGGGSWLFVSHESLDIPGDVSSKYYCKKFGMDPPCREMPSVEQNEVRLIHFKFEAMILHILTVSADAAQHVTNAALSAGFRESGAVGISTKKQRQSTPMVAVRSTGLALDCIIGYQDSDGKNIPVVDEAYLSMLVKISNSRFKTNSERIDRFQKALAKEFEADGKGSASSASQKSNHYSWEDKNDRKERLKAEGLRRQRELKTSHVPKSEDGEGSEQHLEGANNIFD